MSSEPKQHGRTIWDFIADHPKKAFGLMVGILLLCIIIVLSGYNFKSPWGTLDKNLSTTVLDTSKRLNHPSPINSTLNKAQISSRSIPTKSKTLQKKLNSKSTDTLKNNIKYSITAPVTNSAIGDGAINNNFSGIKQRHLTDAQKLDIILKIEHLINQNKKWDKNTLIDIGIPSEDEEAYNYSKEFYGLLKQNKYTNIQVSNASVIGHPIFDYSVQTLNRLKDTCLSIVIIAAKNVN